MALDVIINGPGFGETIILRWHSDRGYRAALIDCHAPANGEFLLNWLRELGIDTLEFIAITNPDLDHIYNADRILCAFAGRVGQLIWWGGLEASSYVIYFQKLARSLVPSSHELVARADNLVRLFAERKRQFRTYGRPTLVTPLGVQSLYSTDSLSILSLAPWSEQLFSAARTVVDSIVPGNRPTHFRSESISLGFLVRYGQAQIVLGGNMTDAAWSTLLNSETCPQINAHAVKVSMHGAVTRMSAGLWTRAGFLNSGTHPVAVVTPYSTTLPNREVIEEIVGSGSKVYVTGQQIGNQRTRPWKSFVHLRFERYGRAAVVETASNVSLFG